MVHIRTTSQHPARAIRFVAQLAGGLAMIAAAIAMTGCGNQEPTRVDGSIAIVPMAGPTEACAAGQYQGQYQGRNFAQNRSHYQQLDVVPYGHSRRNYQPDPRLIQSQGYCDCQPGSQPMCDAQMGVVCVPAHRLGNQQLALWQHGQRGLEFAGFGGYTHYSSGPSQCAAQIGMMCQVGSNTCGQNSFCRPQGHGSPVGVCAQ